MEVGPTPTLNNCGTQPQDDCTTPESQPSNDSLFTPGIIYWFRGRQSPHLRTQWYAGRVLHCTSTRVEWYWLDNECRESAFVHTMIPEQVCEIDLTILRGHPALSRNAIRGRRERRIPEGQSLATSGPWQYFNHPEDTRKWERLLTEWLPAFDPTKLLVTVPRTSPPPKSAWHAWEDCCLAAANLQNAFENITEEGQYHPAPVFDQLNMLNRCLPCLLLIRRRGDRDRAPASVVKKRCTQFLNGNWNLLYQQAVHILQVENTTPSRASVDSQEATRCRRHQAALKQARNLNYSRAMARLQSHGLSTDDPEAVRAALQALHPAAPAPHLDAPAFSPPTVQAFSAINGDWVRKQIRRSKRGTAVDQWGWDSREMWDPFIRNDTLMDEIARAWIKPVAAGYLPAAYRDHLAGGRLVALSKFPKPGVRPICVTDCWRRLAGRGLLQTCFSHLQQYFQGSHPRVFQFASGTPNGPSNMYHLLAALSTELETTATNRDVQDPPAILAIDIKNAFNTLNRNYWLQLLSRGCAHYVKDVNSQNSFGWDLLWPHITAHYGVQGILKHYQAGSTHDIYSASGVQQGDPLGSTLFALGLHPTLIAVADDNPELLVVAFADNVFLLDRLSRVLSAADLFLHGATAIGLSLNTRESAILIPSWLNQPQHESPTELSTPAGNVFPVAPDGIKVLGSPLGTALFSHQTFQATAETIEEDLSLLSEFPYIHLRTKLATFCTNMRISYFLRTVPMSISEPIVQRLDQSFDCLWATSLCFPLQYQSGIDAHRYVNALHQIRLGIRYGGCGCLSNFEITPAAQYCAMMQGLEWLSAHPSALGTEWLAQVNARSEHLRYFVDGIQATSRRLQEWGFSFMDAPPSGPLPGNVLSTLSAIRLWPTDRRPQQGVLCRHIKQRERDLLYSALDMRDRFRIDSISRQELSWTDHVSQLVRPFSSTDYHLVQTPMALFSLTSRYELSNEAFITSTSLLLGLAPPFVTFLRSRHPDYAREDEWGDSLLNKSTHGASTWKQTHSALAQLIASLGTEAGVPCTADERKIPSLGNTNSKGDVMTLIGGVIPSSPNHPVTPGTRLIMDVTLGHVYETSGHSPKPNSLRDAENRKRTKYEAGYRRQGYAFAPLACTSLGQCGPDLLCWLWILADTSLSSAAVLMLLVPKTIPTTSNNSGPSCVGRAH